MKLNNNNAFAVVAVFTYLMVVQASVSGQGRPNPPSRPNIGPTSDAVRDMRERDMNIRRMELEKERSQKQTFEVSKETTRQATEDFAQIQTINAEIMRDYASGAAPDYKHISDVMAEISKRAARLNANLVLPSTEEDGRDPTNQAGSDKRRARSPLLDLNDLVCAFVTNPIFKNLNTIDVELGKKAKRDLRGIIDLSDRISKSADKLSKAAAKHN